MAMSGKIPLPVGAIQQSHAGYRHGHGQNGQKSATYRSWQNMKARCDKPQDPSYADYGGRGICYTPAWADFDAFLADMGERPARTTLDRIDVNGNYEPANCRWALRTEQARNTRRNQFVTFRGKRMTLVELVELTLEPGENYRARYERIRRRVVTAGMSGDEAIDFAYYSKSFSLNKQKKPGEC